ncbi:hypothetical protein RHSIM_Rhsim04G0161000 [Rhododendron simsii]|uniref:MRN complex-interacting protein N-terminal domain-containing protein n=1 Tax=Rhododendron simsii TaxID=118357 RepID=A0A834GYZ7_RHOSS|nr:hypothetical protein RHSIM_Rhsim04G0161000 [Rhododendron simsii]
MEKKRVFFSALKVKVVRGLSQARSRAKSLARSKPPMLWRSNKQQLSHVRRGQGLEAAQVGAVNRRDRLQVKQQKKSTNQWICVVCNEKQSVRKVFAQGFMAKVVPKFVQTCNMSRCQFEQQRSNETLDLVPEHTDDQPRSNNDKKRNSCYE